MLILALSTGTPTELLSQLTQAQPAGTAAGQNKDCRLAIVARTASELNERKALMCSALRLGAPPDHPDVFFSQGTPQAFAWLFPGQGSQSLGMLQGLADVWPAFRQSLQALEQEWSARLGQSLLAWIRATDTAAARAHLNDTRQTQLALGLVEAALASAWRASGLKAHHFAGHSYGELPALATAGAMSTDTLFALSRERGRLLGEAGDLAPGGMLAVKCRRDDLLPHLTALADRVFIANDNAPQQVVLAGSQSGIVEAASLLQAAGIASTPLRTSCAFHSPLMAPITERWTDFLADQALVDIPPQIAYANYSAAAYPGKAESTRMGLATQITASVRWREEIETLYAAGCRNFIEVGPGRVLSDLTRRILGDQPHQMLTSDPGQNDAATHLARLFAQLYALGAEPDLSPYLPPTMSASLELNPSVVNDAAPADHPFFQANQQAVSTFFAQQQQIIGALGGQHEPTLFQEIVRANQSVMQDFLATQQMAMQAGNIPAAKRAPVVPAASLPHTLPTIAASNEIEAWIVTQLAEMTGLPVNRLHRQTKFESELGLDSITLVELWMQISERYPQLGSRPDQIGGVTCIADILRHLESNAPITTTPAKAPPGAAKGSVEAWLFSELSMLTGLPADRLNRQTQFETDLGIDSITMVELWIKLTEEFPAYGAHVDGASRVRSVADVLALIGAEAPIASGEPPTTLAEHPASDWLSHLRQNILNRIAEERGIPPESISGQSHFAKDLGLDIFTRERIFEEEIGRNPKLAFAGRELLNVANLDELTRLLSRFNNLMSDKPLRIGEDGQIVTSDNEAERVGRYVLVGQPPIPASELGSLPERILLIGEDGPNYAKISQAFAACDIAIDPFYLGADCWRHPASEKTVAIDDIKGIADILTQIAPDGRLPAVIYLGISDLSLRGPLNDPSAWHDEVERAGVGLFAFAKAASPIIRAMGRDASVGVLTTPTSAAWAAASGVAKGLAREWPKARIRTVRLLDNFEDMAPRMILKVLTWGPSAHDLQLVRDGVIRQVLIKKPINQDILQARRRHPRLNKDSVILLVGGATGITAEASVMLARTYHAHIVTIGRTTMPETYPYQGISDDASLKRILFDEVNRSDDEDLDAAELVRAEHARIRRQREVWTNRERVLEAGGRFSYYQCDITDPIALAETLSTIRTECGAVHGLIHGAGVIDDCLIEKKTVAEFKNVYYTKAISVFNLAIGLRHDPLQFVFLFSSLASYTGTPGQTDYVAANEVINATAKYWNARVAYPVRSLLWSVWTESGLAASSATQRQMARLGLAGISNEQGIQLLHEELVAGEKFDDWVLLTPQSTLDYTAGGSVHAPRPTATPT